MRKQDRMSCIKPCCCQKRDLHQQNKDSLHCGTLSSQKSRLGAQRVGIQRVDAAFPPVGLRAVSSNDKQHSKHLDGDHEQERHVKLMCRAYILER